MFIERSAERCAQLEALKSEFSHLASDIQIRRGDANTEIQVCRKDWTSHRAVLFLDPYGMQVEWTTIEAIAGTKAIDLWLLFPLGIGVNRLLTKSGAIPESWRRRLDLLLGTEDWYEQFYRVESTPTLFGEADRVLTSLLRGREQAGRPYRVAYRQLSTEKRGAVMAQGSGIEWTESTWNPVTGCTKISPGCKYCYAERMAERLQAMGQENYPPRRGTVLLQAVGRQEQEKGGAYARGAHVEPDAEICLRHRTVTRTQGVPTAVRRAWTQGTRCHQ